MCVAETHQFCNMFSLVMMCRTCDGDKLLDSEGKELTCIDDMVDDIANTSSLNKKPKLITIQAYPGTFACLTIYLEFPQFVAVVLLFRRNLSLVIFFLF